MLTVTPNGQVTLAKEHLDIGPGGQIEVNALPSGRIEIKALRPAGTINNFIGLLANKNLRVATIEELAEATAHAWAGPK